MRKETQRPTEKNNGSFRHHPSFSVEAASNLHRLLTSCFEVQMISLAPRLKTLFRSCLVLGHIFMSLKGLRQMRGAAMSLPAALSGPVLILLSASGFCGSEAES
ncbi:hypothetical protein CHARACLAT_025193 [Characodon lateralis]|uniref:Uncharacterized protein n=1 Tax=Characodon lateralis TaxID=208331 RepID=A0ABU7CRU5_9TELE|nr:hypothetical protein [Characodon lateralis]